MTSNLEKQISLSIWNRPFQKMIIMKVRLRRRFKLDVVDGKKLTAELRD